MKILQVVHKFPSEIGGTQVYVSSLCKELSKKNEVLLFSSERMESAQCTRKYSYEGVSLVSANSFLKSNKLTRLFFNYININIEDIFRAVLENFKPDIVHFHHLNELSINLPHIVHRLKIPAVFSIHDYWLLCAVAHLLDSQHRICSDVNKKRRCVDCLWKSRMAKFSKINLWQISSYKEALVNCAKMRFNILSLLASFFDILYARSVVLNKSIRNDIDLFIVSSHNTQDNLIRHGFPKDKFIYLDPGIDAIAFNASLKAEIRRTRFAYFGPIVFHKGIDVLISAFNNISGATLHIYGSLEKGAEAAFFKLIKNKNIEFKGPFRHEEVGRILSYIDILVVPSLCIENSPLTIREAFAAKVPVIASRIGGIPELIRDGENGLLFKTGDVNELRSKIQYLIDNPREIEKMKERILPVKSIEEHANEIEEIYARLIKYNKA